MKKYFLLCLFLTLTTVSGYSKDGYSSYNVSEKSVVTDFTQVDLRKLVNEINGFLPFSIDIDYFVLKEVDLEDNILNLYVQGVKSNRGDWGKNPHEIGEYLIAIIVLLPGALDEASKLDKKVIEELREKKTFADALDNPHWYKKMGQLMKCAKDNKLAVQFHLRSKDGYKKTIYLTPETVKDATIYSREILEKISKDKTISF